MDIIEEGVPPARKKYQGRCNNCNSLIEAIRSELSIQWDSKECEEFGKESCPICEEEMIFYPKKE